MDQSAPAHLLRTRRFAPLFWTQALGGFNDNLFKQAMALLVAFQAGAASGLDQLPPPESLPGQDLGRADSRQPGRQLLGALHDVPDHIHRRRHVCASFHEDHEYLSPT